MLCPVTLFKFKWTITREIFKFKIYELIRSPTILCDGWTVKNTPFPCLIYSKIYILIRNPISQFLSFSRVCYVYRNRSDSEYDPRFITHTKILRELNKCGNTIEQIKFNICESIHVLLSDGTSPHQSENANRNEIFIYWALSIVAQFMEFIRNV